MEADGEIAALRAEVESLKTLVQELAAAGAGGGEGFGPDFGLPITPLGGDSQGAFRWEGDKITHCYFQFGRQIYAVGNGTVQASGDAEYYLLIPHDYPSNATIVTTTQGTGSDLTRTRLPHFQVSTGEIIKDYRGMPVVPARE